MSTTENVMDKVVNLAKRRGFVFQSALVTGTTGAAGPIRVRPVPSPGTGQCADPSVHTVSGPGPTDL